MEMEDIDSEKYKTVIKEIKGDTSRGRGRPYSWIGWANIVKMAILLKAKYRFKQSLYKYQ